MKRIAIFASGNGSNFEAIVSACERAEVAAQVVLLVCDRADAYVVERAARHGVDTFVFEAKDYASKADFEREIVWRLDDKSVDLICLAGYMRIVGDELLASYGGCIINIHPSLLPAFKGAHAIKQAFEYGVKVYGVTVHYVDASLDGGRIVAQSAFEYQGDDVCELETMVHEVEHKLYIDSIKKLINR